MRQAGKADLTCRSSWRCQTNSNQSPSFTDAQASGSGPPTPGIVRPPTHASLFFICSSFCAIHPQVCDQVAEMSENLNLYQQLVHLKPKHSLFFAIMIPPLEADMISELFHHLRIRYPIQQKQIPSKRLHVSLFPIHAADSLPETIVQKSLLTGNAIRFVEFDLSLNKVLSYRHKQEEKPLVLAADMASSRTTNRLVDHIQHTLSILSGTPTYRTAHINPHVTLVWDRLSVPEHTVPSITLPVREVALVHSHIGNSRYDVLGRWPLVSR